MTSKVKWTQEAIVKALRTAGAERGRAWTITEWVAARRRPDPSTIVRRLGWSAAWAKAGYAPRECGQRRRRAPRWTPERVVEAMRVAAAEGRRMTMRDWVAAGRRPCLSTILKIFGSWSAALAAAGVAMEPRRSKGPDHEALTAAYDRLTAELGRRPRRKDWDAWPERPCSAWTAWRRLGWPPGDEPVNSLSLGIPLDQIVAPRAGAWAARWQAGETLAAIAASEGVSRQWVSFVIQRAARCGGRRPRRHRAGRST